MSKVRPIAEEYDTVLAHCIDSEESKQKALFYDSIAAAVERAGHSCFVPYKHVGWPGDPDEKDPRNTYVLINDVMIPSADLVIVYLGIPSTSLGMMLGSVLSTGRNALYLVERDAPLEPKVDALVHHDPKLGIHKDYRKVGVIEFDSEDQAVQELEGAVRSHFSNANSEAP